MTRTLVLGLIAAGVGERRLCVRALGFHQVQADEACVKADEVGEQRKVSRQRYAWEVGFEEVGVAVAVFRAVEHGVEVVEHILRAEGSVETAGIVGNEFEADSRASGINATLCSQCILRTRPCRDLRQRFLISSR